MATTTATIAADEIVFNIPGQALPGASPAVPGTIKASVRVGAQRGAGDVVRVAARPGEDVVVLSIANGPTLVLAPENARDLMLSQQGAPTRGPADGDPPGSVTIPAQLSWPGLEALPTRGGVTRGWLGQVLLQAVQVITGIGVGNLANVAAGMAVKKLDGQVNAGVYRLQRAALEPLISSGQGPVEQIDSPGDKPLLVLLHGTFVDTCSTFKKLWSDHPDIVARLFDGYADNVYALDHPTVGASPIANALTLARALPQGARLHLITHSRGGLVAEVLARACSGVSAADLALFVDTPDRDYAAQRQDLQALATLLQQRQVKVERMVRVACPSRGTLLASKRLDAYLSVLKWGLELAHVPVAPQLVEFLGAVAQHRANPEEMPGIEAMMPTSPIVAWLNRADAALPGQLRVVAGDLQGDSVGTWVKTLLADAFYWTDNDLVVQTRSMYGGTPRANEGASFLLDQGGGVTHFNYFGNQRTASAIANAALLDSPPEFRLIGPLSWGGTDASGTRAGRAIERSKQPQNGVPATGRPAVVILPGILGSNLALDGQRIWLGARFINGLQSLAWDAATASRVTDDGPIGRVYDDLIDHLADTHEIIPFGYDWRRPLEDEAARLATRVQQALDARNDSKQPVRFLAHSMGGLLARTMQLVQPALWKRLLARDGARVLMLGTPNGGSWAPMQTLSGDDTFGNVLAAAGSLFDSEGARQVMAGMPGFLQLQAGLLDPSLALDQSATWKALADDDLRRIRQRNFWHSLTAQLGVYTWSAPPQAVLDAAVLLRKKLDAQLDQLDSGDRQKMLLVVGRAKFTPAGMRMGEGGLEYLDAVDGGDGRVTLKSATQIGVATWRAEAEHGSLPSLRSAFDGYLDLLQSGETTKLPPLDTAGGTRGGGDPAKSMPTPELVPNRPSRGRKPSAPPSTEVDMYGDAADSTPGTAAAALPITVRNGNLKFCSVPLMLGHYRSNIISGAEKVVDTLIGGGMKASLAAGLYPGAIGSHQVFLNKRVNPDQPLALPRPKAVIVVGLGEEGSLRVSDLTRSVRQAVIACSQHQREGDGAMGFELASTLVGSGGTGMSPSGAAQAIAQGVRDANEQLSRIEWPLVTRLVLYELYLDRATEAHKAIAVLSDANPSRFALSPSIVSATGALRRPLESSYRGATYDFVSVAQRYDQNMEPVIEYTLDTQRARSEVRGQSAQSKLVDELVRIGADSQDTDAKLRRSLFQLLVPVEIEPFLAGSTTMLLQLDSDTARIPWELLDAGKRDSSDAYPWAVRTQLLRKLRTDKYRETPINASREHHVLVIGEPLTNSDQFAPLPAARREAELVAKALGAPALVNSDALEVVKALLAEPLRLVHIAGHGDIFKTANGSEIGGVVLSNGMMLGPREIESMRTVPELVFVNCCFIGQIKPKEEKPRAPGQTRASFASSVAEQLIRIGVRCVVAAGWAVEDEPAMVFATTFYDRLLAGERFIDAVGTARKAAYDKRPEGNTWAAYQCYGDPDWRYVTRDDVEAPSLPDVPIVSAPALALTLETAALDEQYKESGDDAKRASQSRLKQIRQLDRRYADQWGGIGAVAEAFGLAYAAHGDVDAAIAWYLRALAATDASASFKCAEQLGNLLARRGGKSSDDERGEADIADAIRRLDALVSVAPSAERESLLGSAWKLRAALATKRADDKTAHSALAKAQQYYLAAEDRARRSGAVDLFYPAMNALGCELRLAFLDGKPPALTASRLAEVRQSLQAKAMADPDFWAIAGISELSLMEALASGQLASALPPMLQDLRDLKARVSAGWMWDSVLKQTRFIVEPYMATAELSAAEQQAGQQLIKELTAIVSS